MYCCEVCEKDMPDYEPVMCCTGYFIECGCMGRPIEPAICSEECWDILMEKFKVKTNEG